MGLVTWGLLGPEVFGSERRVRTLGLGASVRSFNDLAVPGLGGVWFGKQLLLATLGVAVAECLRNSGKRAQNIEVANAVEALACWLALESNGWKSDPRLRGALKLFGKKDLSFATVRKPSFYVTQPMRQATVQPLRALGLVESNGERFNAFRCTEQGEAFISAGFAAFRPHKRLVLDHLVMWANEAHDDVTSSAALMSALSPLTPMSDSANEFLRERMVQGTDSEASRRRRALDWVKTLRAGTESQIDWDAKPAMVDEQHWGDLHAGALFFDVRDAAIALLDQIETNIGEAADLRMALDATFPENIEGKLTPLRERAQTFLNQNYDPSPGMEATKFCRESAEPIAARLLANLLLREGRVLQLRDGYILPGVAFTGKQVRQPGSARSSEEDGMEIEAAQVIHLPRGISHRVRNLFWLNLDLRNELDDWLTGTLNNGGGEQ